jgi:hypothetical protein
MGKTEAPAVRFSSLCVPFASFFAASGLPRKMRGRTVENGMEFAIDSRIVDPSRTPQYDMRRTFPQPLFIRLRHPFARNAPLAGILKSEYFTRCRDASAETIFREDEMRPGNATRTGSTPARPRSTGARRA